MIDVEIHNVPRRKIEDTTDQITVRCAKQVNRRGCQYNLKYPPESDTISIFMLTRIYNNKFFIADNCPYR